jgi:hypothetical protein
MLEGQSNISRANIDTAAAWTRDESRDVATLASLVVEIGHVHPRSRKRRGNVRRSHPELFQRMVAAGLAVDWADAPDVSERAGSAMPEEGDPFSGNLVDDDIPF